MSAAIIIERAGPLTTLQDAGRFDYLAQGISASGPMDCAAFRRAGLFAGAGEGAGIEFSMLGIDLLLSESELSLGWDGGTFQVAFNGKPHNWPGGLRLKKGDRLNISSGKGGNYGYLRFGGNVDVPNLLGSRSTSLRARIGGLEGRVLTAGDTLRIIGEGEMPSMPGPAPTADGPIRFIWGLHADVFDAAIREKFVTSRFRISSMMDRMGVRIRDESGVFAEARILSLVSDPVVVGDIQILGDGTPIVLGRDHQPTGGYPRIGTVISADLDRFFQLRPNAEIAFSPIGLDHAQALLRSGP